MNNLGTAPEILTPTARAIWEDMAPEIERLGLEVERAELALYAQTVGDFIDLAGELKTQGLGIEGDPGELDVNPTLYVSQWLTDRALDLAQRLGFTPAARLCAHRREIDGRGRA